MCEHLYHDPAYVFCKGHVRRGPGKLVLSVVMSIDVLHLICWGWQLLPTVTPTSGVKSWASMHFGVKDPSDADLRFGK